ncbi:Os01g0755600, partial [Oryza sativa Japonica Group]
YLVIPNLSLASVAWPQARTGTAVCGGDDAKRGGEPAGARRHARRQPRWPQRPGYAHRRRRGVLLLGNAVAVRLVKHLGAKVVVSVDRGCDRSDLTFAARRGRRRRETRERQTAAHGPGSGQRRETVSQGSPSP